MKPCRLLRRIRDWLPPQTWRAVFAIIFAFLLALLAVAAAIDYLKGTLP